LLNVQIITEAPGWILRAISEKIIKYNIHPQVHFSFNKAKARFFVDAYLFDKALKVELNIGWFTHPHNGTFKSIPSNVFKLDFIVHQARRYYDMFLEHGFPASKMSHLIAPVELDLFPLKKICLGFSGRMGALKGHQVLKELISRYDLSNFKFKWIGPNLEEFHLLCLEYNIESKLVKIPYEQYSSEYEEFDYLLVPSLAEGGPMCILEAQAKGIPVISADVGIAPEVNVDYIFEPGNVTELYQILKQIENERLARRKIASKFTWQDFTFKLGQIFLQQSKQKGEEI